MPRTFDNTGLGALDKAVYQTVDPQIAKIKLDPDEPLPDYARSEGVINGQRWAYFPTPDAILMGKFQAAVDTVSYIPQQVEQQLTDAARSVRGAVQDTFNSFSDPVKQTGLWVMIGIGAIVAIEIYARTRKGRR